MRVNRRLFLGTAAAAASVGLMPRNLSFAASSAPTLHIAPFRFDVTSPIGHSMCGGWIKPAEVIDDPQEAIGFVLLGAGLPVVVCSVDWTGLLNEAHLEWRKALATAAGTTPDRVAVQCVHQHNAPFACLEAERIVNAEGDLPHIMDVDFFRRCLDAGHQAVESAIQSARSVTHVAHGEAKVDRVAGNRRILGPEGTVISQRGSSSKDPEHHRLPEGLIDPFLKTISFFDGETKLVSCHYYACHPMSYYGDGRVSADFCGLARRRRQDEEPGCTHIYFNGCGGNIGAGKYNDGSREMRPVLVQRIYDAIVASESSLKREAIESVNWVTNEILPPTQDRYSEDEILKQIHNKSEPVVNRNRPSYIVSWIRRTLQKQPITLSGLHVNQTSMLHLPAESFVEYQLEAQQFATSRFVACAAYGDGGPWYIPTEEAYPQGGYEVSVAWCTPAVDPILTAGVQALLKG